MGELMLEWIRSMHSPTYLLSTVTFNRVGILVITALDSRFRIVVMISWVSWQAIMSSP